MLNPDYVAQQLIKPGQHVIVYNRNSDLLPEDEQGLPSAFMLYHLQQAKLIKDMLTNCSYNFPSIHFIKFIYVSSIIVCNHFKGQLCLMFKHRKPFSYLPRSFPNSTTYITLGVSRHCDQKTLNQSLQSFMLLAFKFVILFHPSPLSHTPLGPVTLAACSHIAS